MCGRTCLSVNPDVCQQACAYRRNGSNKYFLPNWSEEYNLGKEFSPSYNIAPTDITPVIVSAYNFGQGDVDERILKPMMWGMVPKWHKDDFRKHGLSTNNSRVENILTSKLYSLPLKMGNRCIVLAEGFYEWQTTNSSKQPYYIFLPQSEGTKMHDLSSFKNMYNENEGWEGMNLLRMAAIYDEWSCDEGALYSYSIITLETDSQLNWLHHRMPAILETDKEVNIWLNSKEIPYSEAVASLKPASKLSWYPVSTLVNNSREKSSDCNHPIADPNTNMKSTKKGDVSGSRKLMEKWLKSGKDPTEPDTKKCKK